MRVLAPFCLWLVVPLGLWLVVVLYGTPHLAVSYRFLDNGDRFNPLAERHYTSCTYWGWTGVRRVPADYGQCPWIRFFDAGPHDPFALSHSREADLGQIGWRML